MSDTAVREAAERLVKSFDGRAGITVYGQEGNGTVSFDDDVLLTASGYLALAQQLLAIRKLLGPKLELNPLSHHADMLLKLLNTHHGFDGNNIASCAPISIAEAASAIGVSEDECEAAFDELFGPQVMLDRAEARELAALIRDGKREGEGT